MPKMDLIQNLKRHGIMYTAQRFHRFLRVGLDTRKSVIPFNQIFQNTTKSKWLPSDLQQSTTIPKSSGDA